MSAVVRFENDFLKSSSANRAAILQKAVALNQGSAGIVNLLANVDLNYKKDQNPVKEAQVRNKPDNIFFITKMLRAFPDFRYQ